MLTHYATLTYLAGWLDSRLTGASIREIYSQSRNELMMCFTMGEQQASLRISVEPRMNYVYLIGDTRRAKRNSINLFPSLIGKTVAGVRSVHQDRIILIECSDKLSGVIQMFGSAANVLVIDQHNVIRDSFVRAKETTGNSFSGGHGMETGTGPLISVTVFFNALQSSPASFLREALKSMFPSLGKTLIGEILHRMELEPATAVASMTDDRQEALYNAIRHLFSELERPVPRIYYDNDRPVAFSLVPLSHSIDLRCEEYDSINEAIRIFVSKSMRDEHVDGERQELQQRLRTEIQKIERTIGKIRTDLTETDRAAQFERNGKILLAYATTIERSQKEVTLDDPVTGASVKISLDPRVTPLRNAEKFFDRAKKARVARRESEERLMLLEKRLSGLHALQEGLAVCHTGEALKEFARQNIKLLKVYHMIKSEKGDEPLPFRVFHVTGGFEVWAGKSSKNNDELTLHYAKPADLWFHARGSAGSHVILRAGTGNGEPSKQAKEQTAAIAAYYSKQRNAKYVPVAMTEKKYVRKPKGASAGTVIIDREKVLMVTPALPAKDENEE